MDETDRALAAEESPFARAADGFLVRDTPATRRDLTAPVVGLRIDGELVTDWPDGGGPITRAVPLTDELGQPVHGPDGLVVPRATTIYDVIARGRGAADNPVPVLCHQPHLRPVAACRVCSVLVMKATDRRPPAKLFPACQHRVESGMVVHTAASAVEVEWRNARRPAGEVVGGLVRTLAELLVTDHLPDYHPGAARPHHELWAVAARLGVPPPGRFPLPLAPKGRPGAGPADASSPFIAVDHAACILCDRCSRGCGDVRRNHVIGRTGKGYDTRVGFDLDDPMGESSCVRCGECAVWCPTDALTITRPLDAAAVGAVPAAELAAHPLFGRLPYKLLDWLRGAVVRRRVGRGGVLFREGEYGSSAFLLESGSVAVEIRAPAGRVRAVRGRSWWDRVRGRSFLERLEPGPAARPVRTDAGVSLSGGQRSVTVTATGGVRFLGETACLNNYPYGSTATAVEPVVVLEVRRNVLLALLRHPDTRRVINENFRNTALAEFVRGLPLAAPLTGEQVAAARAAAEFVRVAPGQTIYTPGEPAADVFLVRVGFVRLTTAHPDGCAHDYVGPGGLLGIEPGPTRPAAAALDHVELIRFPATVIAPALRAAPPPPPPPAPDATLDSFLERGLFHARSLLVLDLNKCTRCDECTKACADTHGGVTRLIREGLRFENFLVATSCRSCLDPTCMVGCPVDAIHRQGDREIRVADHCIGCGLCERSCPYGNIRMSPVPGSAGDRKAVNCDLCAGLVGEAGEPNCVYACPHDAAHRYNGTELFRLAAAARGADR
jgi:Fe-S-cluster-containing dehydrogenase component/CRP-like cAMP-binding protein